MAPPPRYASSSDDSIQKYMLLSSQQEILKRRLSLHIPSATPMAAPSSEYQSLASSPTYSQPAFHPAWSTELDYSSTYPRPTDPVQPSVAHRHSIADTEDAHKLCEINQEIKATLTELLNTESVRADEKYRQWIQGRLMDAEHQIRLQRRRRSSGSNSDREIASSIAEHLDPLQTCKTWG